mmetsp:Transcript_21102/g.63480  ORF Transcript_21102/g.63480 Transcript_21102/m.63480 type:complete len:212 (-) Transcript_21102:418-1053(-)
MGLAPGTPSAMPICSICAASRANISLRVKRDGCGFPEDASARALSTSLRIISDILLSSVASAVDAPSHRLTSTVRDLASSRTGAAFESYSLGKAAIKGFGGMTFRPKELTAFSTRVAAACTALGTLSLKATTIASSMTSPCSSSTNAMQTSVAFDTVCTRCFSTLLAMPVQACSDILAACSSVLALRYASSASNAASCAAAFASPTPFARS